MGKFVGVLAQLGMLRRHRRCCSLGLGYKGANCEEESQTPPSPDVLDDFVSKLLGSLSAANVTRAIGVEVLLVRVHLPRAIVNLIGHIIAVEIDQALEARPLNFIAELIGASLLARNAAQRRIADLGSIAENAVVAQRVIDRIPAAT